MDRRRRPSLAAPRVPASAGRLRLTCCHRRFAVAHGSQLPPTRLWLHSTSEWFKMPASPVRIPPGLPRSVSRRSLGTDALPRQGGSYASRSVRQRGPRTSRLVAVGPLGVGTPNAPLVNGPQSDAQLAGGSLLQGATTGTWQVETHQRNVMRGRPRPALAPWRIWPVFCELFTS